MHVDDPVTTRIPIASGTLLDLQRHLHAARNLELWTIPVYLTALASIRVDESSIRLPPTVAGQAGATTNVTRLLVSVALQEMFHLQITGNVAQMFEVKRPLDWPTYTGTIPYLEHQPPGVSARLGTIDDDNTMRLMVAIEAPMPDEHDGLHDARDVPKFGTIQYDAAGLPCYPSIGALYSVAVQLADRWRAAVDAGAPQLANGLFGGWYSHTGLIQPATLDEALDIIVSQGESRLHRPAAPIDDPAAVPDPGAFADPFAAENRFGHWERFERILDNANRGVTTWPTAPGGDVPAQARFGVLFARLLDGLHAGWSGAPPDLGPMFLARTALTQIYAAGQVPSFAAPGPDAPSWDAVLMALAPREGATWADHVRTFFTITDVEGMKANGLRQPDLGDRGSVRAHQATLVAVTRNGDMPPGELNAWSSAQVDSLAGWKGD